MSMKDDIRILTAGTHERNAYLEQQSEEREMMERISFHLLKAKSKHPDFPESTYTVPPTLIPSMLKAYRMMNNGPEESVVTVLQEEVLEAVDACNQGDIEAAIDEAYDAVAVLLRWIAALKQKKGGE